MVYNQESTESFVVRTITMYGDTLKCSLGGRLV